MDQSDQETKRNLEILRLALQSLQTLNLPDSAAKSAEMALKAFNDLSDGFGGQNEQGRLAALYQVSQVLGTSLDLDEVLNQVMDAVIGLTGAERGFLVLLEDGLDNPNMRVGRNFNQEDMDGMEISRTILRTVAETGQGTLTSDAQQDPRFSGQESVIGMNLRSVMASPLRSRDEVIGVIYVDNRAQTGIFADDDLKMLNTFASQAATAIQNARLYADTDRTLGERVRELESLAKISRELNNQETIEDVVLTTQKWTKDLLKAEEVWAVVQVDDGYGTFLQAMQGPQDGNEISKEEPFVKGAMEAMTPHVYPSDDGSERLVAPLLSGGKAIGVLIAESPTEFPPGALPFLTRLANQVALAIDKAQIHDKIAKMDDEKAEFVSTVTHELRLPMTSILGYTDLLKQGAMGPVNEQQLNFLTVIRNNVGRMNRLVSDISDYSKAESGRLLLEPAMFSMQDAVSYALENQKEAMQEKQQELALDISSALPQAYGDPKRIEQVITSMIDNAVKYSGEGAKIEVSASPQTNSIKITVKDSGLGIEEKEQESVFTQFFRSERQEIRDVQGWGMNLAVAKYLVELMDGDIGFKSETDVGSTFWFTVPLQARS